MLRRGQGTLQLLRRGPICGQYENASLGASTLFELRTGHWHADVSLSGHRSQLVTLESNDGGIDGEERGECRLEAKGFLLPSAQCDSADEQARQAFGARSYDGNDAEDDGDQHTRRTTAKNWTAGPSQGFTTKGELARGGGPLVDGNEAQENDKVDGS